MTDALETVKRREVGRYWLPSEQRVVVLTVEERDALVAELERERTQTVRYREALERIVDQRDIRGPVDLARAALSTQEESK